MRYGKISVYSFAIGITLVISGLYIKTLDFGSCAISPTGKADCAHTFQNTNIYITPTGNAVIEVGIGFLIVSLMVFLFGQAATKKHKTTIEADFH